MVSGKTIRTGDRIHELEVVEILGDRIRCRCDCGGVVTMPAIALLNGRTKSCGCRSRGLRARAGLPFVVRKEWRA